MVSKHAWFEWFLSSLCHPLVLEAGHVAEVKAGGNSVISPAQAAARRARGRHIPAVRGLGEQVAVDKEVGVHLGTTFHDIGIHP